MNTKYIRLITALLFSVFLAGCNLNPFAKKAGLQITANVESNLIINGQPAGKTPYYKDSEKAGNYTIQISAVESGQVWEEKVTLLGGTLTMVHRNFGETPDKSSGHTLSFEKLSNNKVASANIISLPASTTTSVDGKPQGFTPLSLDIEPGPRVFTFAAPGYQDKMIEASVQPGFRLILNINLATSEVVPTPTPALATPSAGLATPTPGKVSLTPLPKQATSSATLTKPYLEILATPTNWLNVRESASTTATILAKVNPGDKFPYKESEISGWYQIEYQTGQWGFVSATYAKIVK